MFESLRSRLLLAVGSAVVVAVLINVLFASANKKAERKGADAEVTWKSKTGVELAALPQLEPGHADSAQARELDVLMQPLGLSLSGERGQRRYRIEGKLDEDTVRDLRDTLRAAIRGTNPEAVVLSPRIVETIEKHAKTLDAVAEYVATHQDIRWREDHLPRSEPTRLDVVSHLTIQRLLIGRGFLALSRDDTATAIAMLRTSQILNRAVEARSELMAQFLATSVERMQLALLRRGQRSLGVLPAEPAAGIQERYLRGMSNEAALMLTNARRGAFADDSDEVTRFFGLLAGAKLEIGASAAVTQAASIVAEIRRSPDGCAELAKTGRSRHSAFSGFFDNMNPTEAWRRFAVLELDRAITTAVLTGEAKSPCRSVQLTVREDGPNRIVEAKGLPAESEVVIALPAVVTVRK
jgi:hypothetical protein